MLLQKASVMSVSICRLSARISHKPRIRISSNSLGMLPVAVAQSSSGGVVICHVFPVLCMTSCLLIIGQAKATQLRKLGYLLKVTRQ